MALTSADRALLQRCLNREPGAWNDFVDRFLGLVYHVIHHTAHQRSATLRPEDVEDLAADILLQLVANDYTALRQFQGRSSLATYLAVIARRVCVHELARRAATVQARSVGDGRTLAEPESPPTVEPGLERLEEVQRLLGRLPKKARQIVRLFYLEGRTYEEISTALNIPVNSIGPILSRAKQALRQRSPAKAGAKGSSEAKSGA